jgi:hypothetical protein
VMENFASVISLGLGVLLFFFGRYTAILDERRRRRERMPRGIEAPTQAIRVPRRPRRNTADAETIVDPKPLPGLGHLVPYTVWEEK